MITTIEIEAIEERQKKLSGDINYFFNKNTRLDCQLFLKDLLAAHMQLETNAEYRGNSARFVSELLLLLEAIDPGEPYIMHLDKKGAL